MQIQFLSKNLSKSQLFNNKTLQFLSMNLVKSGSDPSYILLKNETVWIHLHPVQFNDPLLF